MAKRGRVTLDTRKLDRIAATLEQKAEAVVQKTAFDIQADAAGRAPVDTGALRNSIYTVTSRSNGLSAAASAATSAYQAKHKRAPELVELPRPGPAEAWVGPSVEYGLHVELTNRPFLIPAVEAARGRFVKALETLFR